MSTRPFKNRLNDLDPKRWIKFQKSWFIHNPPPRRRDVLRHPAKFPETLAQDFIEFFTKPGGMVLDPMCGTGSAIVAALRCGRASCGVELNPEYARIAAAVVADERAALLQRPGLTELPVSYIVQSDAARIAEIAAASLLPPVDYIITSPPYWDMLRARGAATQKTRRAAPNLDVFYSDDPNDLGNVADYIEFVTRLSDIYAGLKPILKVGAYLTIIVKNVKKGGRIYPLAWDLAARLGEVYTLKDEKIWCQDDIRLAPFGMGNAWVSNTFHHYCLQFRCE
jgi:DNA modification methylase